MISYCKGQVTKIVATYPGCTELEVRTPTGERRAINYDLFTGAVQPGAEVLLNTTAVRLGLGSGGYHFVVAVNNSSKTMSPQQLPKSGGHIMKLRYTPLQFSVLSAEEENSPYHQLFHDFDSLNGLPVIIGELHSMLLPAVFNIKRREPQLKVAYIMTDGGALPAAFSRNLAYLKEQNLIQGTITYGQAFGGDLEAVNIYTALIAAQAVSKADVAVVTMGPGITGTGTKYGWSAGTRHIIDRQYLRRTPVLSPDQLADERPRHRGLSHHSIVLGEIARTRASGPPQLAKINTPHLAQLKTHRLDQTQIVTS